MRSEFPLRMDRSVPFVDAVFRIVEGAGSEHKAAQILLSAEGLTKVKFLSTAPSKRPTEIEPERYSEIVETRMSEFLSQTNLVLGSAEYNALHVLIDDDYTYSWTHREWGHMMAKWANSKEWLGRTEWQYLDFYGGLNDRLIEHYNAWSATALRVIAVKEQL